MWIYIYIYIYVYLYIHMYMYISTRVCVCVCTLLSTVLSGPKGPFRDPATVVPMAQPSWLDVFFWRIQNRFCPKGLPFEAKKLRRSGIFRMFFFFSREEALGGDLYVIQCNM